MPIDFQTDNIIIVVYPQGAGGKTLTNALGLSQSSVLQKEELAAAQLENQFTALDKFNYLNKMMLVYKDTKIWTDLDLGCYDLFGVTAPKYVYLEKNSYLEYFFNKIIEKIINKKLYFFLVAHSISELPHIGKIWTNAKYIIFDNSIDVLTTTGRTNYFNEAFFVNDIKKLWRLYKGEDWPDDPCDGFINLPINVKQELLETPDFYKLLSALKLADNNRSVINNFFQSATKKLSIMTDKNKVYRYDAKNLLDNNQFVWSVKSLMAEFNMEIPDEHLIREYHKIWLEVVKSK